MTARHPEAKQADLQRWRRLVREGQACARNPLRSTGDLFAAANAANGAVFPRAPFDRSNPFNQLRDLALRFCADRRNRVALQDELSERSAACADLVGVASAAAEPARRFRADIDG